MKQVHLKIDVVQDGALVKDDIIFKYDLKKRDLSYSVNGKSYINFVGVVQRGSCMLFSIPKHFMNINEFRSLDDSTQKQYIRLIVDSIQKSVSGSQNTTYQDSDDVCTDWALDAYFKVYLYFSKYGLYHEERIEANPHQGGKISWKKTLHKSSKFISGKNIIFSPLFYKKKQTDETIVTDSMVFVMNYTQLLLGEYMNLPKNDKIMNRGIDWTILGNELVIVELQKILTRTFKDIDKVLIQNIIIFLKRVNEIPHKFPDIKDYNYNHVWERAVQKFLLERFDRVDTNNNVIFTDKNNLNNKYRFNKPNIYYNKIHPKWSLHPDHYFCDDESKTLYIFDSKYYKNLNELNHKQFVYHILLTNRYSDYDIFDSLVVPYEGFTHTEAYLSVKDTYLLKPDKPIDIYVTQLNMIEVLKNYVDYTD